MYQTEDDDRSPLFTLSCYWWLSFCLSCYLSSLRLVYLALQLLGKFTGMLGPVLFISTALSILLGNKNLIIVLCVSLSPSTDSMIRVGGDYQAQIPEFKPGKLGERKACWMIWYEISEHVSCYLAFFLNISRHVIVHVCLSEATPVIALCLLHCLALSWPHWPLLCLSALQCAGCSRGVLPVTV